MITIDKVGVFHNYLHDKLKSRFENPYDKRIVIKRKDLRAFLGWFNVPWRIHEQFIKEMEDLSLLKTKDKQNVIIIRKKPTDWFE